jgi:hypothetical protein
LSSMSAEEDSQELNIVRITKFLKADFLRKLEKMRKKKINRNLTSKSKKKMMSFILKITIHLIFD